MSIISKVMELPAKASEHKAELGIIFGGICGGAAIVSACIATLNLEDILDEHNAKVEEVKDKHITLEKVSDDGAAITETIDDAKAYKRELTKVYLSTACKVGANYAPTAAILAITAYFLGGSYKSAKELKKENVELFTALRGSEAILKRYRDDMRERVGEEEEQRFYNNIRTKDIEIIERTDDKEKKKKVKGAEVINGELSGDAFIFDERCGSYVGHDIDHNMFIAGMLKNQCSDNLYCNGSLLMFEILDAFGLDRDEVPGAFVRGYISRKQDRDADKIAMDIRKVWVYDEMTDEYVEKILIDPKLDGVIVDKI